MATFSGLPLGCIFPEVPLSARMPGVDNYVSLPVAPVIVKAPQIAYPMYGNDLIGDCTAAAAGHQIETWSYVAGLPLQQPSEAEVEAFYNATKLPGQDGAVIETVLAYWKSNLLGGVEILGYAPITVSNVDQIKSAISLFGGCYVGIEMPASGESQFSAQVPWNPTGSPEDKAILGGHCVNLIGYNEYGFIFVTWGRLYLMSYAWWAEFGFEAYAIIPSSFQNSPLVDIATLQSDLAQL